MYAICPMYSPHQDSHNCTLNSTTNSTTIELKQDLIIVDSIARILNGPTTATIVIMGITLNLISIWGFLRPLFKHQRIPIIMYYLIAVAAWDCALCLGALLMYSIPTLYYGEVTIYMDWYTHLMPFIYYMSHTSLTGSVWIMLALSIDRYLAIVYPLKHKLINPATVPRVLIAVTVSPLFFCLPDYYRLDVGYCISLNSSSCEYELVTPVISETQFSNTEIYSFWYRLVGGFATYSLLPFTILIFITVRIAMKLNEASRARRAMTSTAMSRLDSESVKHESLDRPSVMNRILSDRRLTRWTGRSESSSTDRPDPTNNNTSSIRDRNKKRQQKRKSSTLRNSCTEKDKLNNNNSNTHAAIMLRVPLVERSTTTTTPRTSMNKGKSLPPVNKNDSESKMTRAQKSNTMHAAVIFKFVMCRILCAVLDMVEKLDKQRFNQSLLISTIVHFSNLFVVLNSATSFFLYVYYSRQFRQTLRDLLPSCWLCAKSGTTPSILTHAQYRLDNTGNGLRCSPIDSNQGLTRARTTYAMKEAEQWRMANNGKCQMAISPTLTETTGYRTIEAIESPDRSFLTVFAKQRSNSCMAELENETIIDPYNVKETHPVIM